MLACPRIVNRSIVAAAPYCYPWDEQAGGFKTDLYGLWMFDHAIIRAFPCKGSDLCRPVCQREGMAAACLGAVRIRYAFSRVVACRESSVWHRADTPEAAHSPMRVPCVLDIDRGCDTLSQHTRIRLRTSVTGRIGVCVAETALIVDNSRPPQPHKVSVISNAGRACRSGGSTIVFSCGR